ncbi:MAG: hypothetical protein LBE84_03350 [Planctomycetota bacterium]|jgi:predicted DNA-binding transcriptional regulator AlpA|nr:hypothetical protein [Planctomycetota bacterium]
MSTINSIDIPGNGAIMKADGNIPSALIRLSQYGEDDLVGKPELCRIFGCSGRTLQRMAERFELPPPMSLAGRKFWIIGNIRAWISESARRREAEAMREARRLKIFDL